MKHLEEFLEPLLNRMRRGAGWLLSVLLVTVVAFTYICLAIGWLFNIHSRVPGLVGLCIGAAVFIGLFVLLVHSTKPPS